VQAARISNSRLKPKGDVARVAVEAGAGGLAFARVANGQLEGAKPLREGLDAEQTAQLIGLCQAADGDLLLFAAGPEAVVNRCVPPHAGASSLRMQPMLTPEAV
jgi:aspartyl-tRNA synthetase